MLTLSLAFGTGSTITSAEAKWTEIDVAGSFQTTPMAISDIGVVTGSWIDDSGIIHGFVRARDGTITSFDAAEGVNTDVLAINKSGLITGYYTDFSGDENGFVRAPDGTIVVFVVPDTINTTPSGVNGKGAITGYAYSHRTESYIGFFAFLRKLDGTIVTLDRAGWTFCQVGSGQNGGGINASGAIAGGFTDSSGDHRFLMQADGKLRKLDYPGRKFETIPVGINAKNDVTGDYLDSTFEEFVWKPRH